MTPRVHEILKAVGPHDSDPFWLKPKYFRRGRLVEACATTLAKGIAIEDEWWQRASGEREDDRVEHEECRRYVAQVERLLREHKIRLIDAQVEVRHPALNYIGHLDWLLEHNNRFGIWDIKCGEPPAPDSPFDYYCRIQLALYQLAYFRQHEQWLKTANLHIWPDGYRIVARNNPADRDTAMTVAHYYHERLKWRGTE